MSEIVFYLILFAGCFVGTLAIIAMLKNAN
jgi:hypothetical protein